MEKPAFDPGLTQQYVGTLKRALNPNGQFNVRRTGATWRDAHPYLFLIGTSWPSFAGALVAAFFVVNLFFTALYLAIGVEHLKGAESRSVGSKVLGAFFFSTDTLTTLGSGSVFPNGIAANALAAAEAMTGVAGLALATSLLFGRFARPSARIGFSEGMVVAPYMGGSSLQLRTVNRRKDDVIELEAKLLLMTAEWVEGRHLRRYFPLELERDSVLFMALTWTIVHPISESSPLYKKTPEDLARLQAEFIVLLKGFDETFGQTVYTRRSYRYDEIEWGARFAPAFKVDEEDGDLRLELDRVGAIERPS
ncbi:MAG TPA: ion channel [Bryobacteraceae bacterium]